MTAIHFAHLLHAKRNGRGRWLAHCPAHHDRSPSLSIAEGRNGHVLVHCWAGCETVKVLSSMGLRLSALFDNSNLNVDEIRARRTISDQAAAQERALRLVIGDAADDVRQLEWLVNNLGARLARSKDEIVIDDSVREFHVMCFRLHLAEARFQSLCNKRPAANGPQNKGPLNDFSKSTRVQPVFRSGRAFE
jgi:hypothetical protein